MDPFGASEAISDDFAIFFPMQNDGYIQVKMLQQNSMKAWTLNHLTLLYSGLVCLLIYADFSLRTRS